MSSRFADAFSALLSFAVCFIVVEAGIRALVFFRTPAGMRFSDSVGSCLAARHHSRSSTSIRSARAYVSVSVLRLR
jgi:hypothetical protein